MRDPLNSADQLQLQNQNRVPGRKQMPGNQRRVPSRSTIGGKNDEIHWIGRNGIQNKVPKQHSIIQK